MQKNRNQDKLPIGYYEYRELVKKRLLYQEIVEVFYIINGNTEKKYDFLDLCIPLGYPFHGKNWEQNKDAQTHIMNSKILFRLKNKGIIGILPTKKWTTSPYKYALDILQKGEQTISPTSQSINVSETIFWKENIEKKIIQVDVYWLGKQDGMPMALKITFSTQESMWIALVEMGVSEMTDMYCTEFMTLFFSEKTQAELADFNLLSEIATYIDIIK
ncbi:hypothetical protein Fleli_3316 [Bernardetia litoralis DSM 6794]|uniref:Uncharacterized protein n=1 Tax=Bernardetia litoralis (strain ATCC 23117 / DSM 6794 / NBRC 15988 / NCIMB 1366 / Fx l1 / Sio-4) TaxID=880071 RepID=I4ANW0_BERLS|nr:hypothetical protein [Bernardetia litoralis]AFM05645.1 hypothetical protein Fleli_3316 [Bernardetia litoralis DSM 6794]